MHAAWFWGSIDASEPNLIVHLLCYCFPSVHHLHQPSTENSRGYEPVWALKEPVHYRHLYLHRRTRWTQKGHSRTACVFVGAIRSEWSALLLIPLSLRSVTLNVLPPIECNHTSVKLSSSSPSPTERTNTTHFQCVRTHTDTEVHPFSLYLCLSSVLAAQQLTCCSHLFSLSHTALLLIIIILIMVCVWTDFGKCLHD